MTTWSTFAAAKPGMAKVGEELLWLSDASGGTKAGLGYLATVREDNGPRIHPISPALVNGVLYAFVLRTSPRRRDLLRNGRYALHSFPHRSLYTEDYFRDEEFYVAGRANLVKDSSTRQVVADTCGDQVESGDVFELSLEVALNKQRESGKTVYSKWKSDSGQSP